MSRPAKPPVQGKKDKPRIDPFQFAGKAGWGSGGEYVVKNGQRIRVELPPVPQNTPADQPEKKEAE